MQGTCTFGDGCRNSHDPSVALDSMGMDEDEKEEMMQYMQSQLQGAVGGQMQT